MAVTGAKSLRILAVALLGFAQAGPADAQSDLAQTEPASAPLVVEDLECRGNSRTPCSFILGHLYLFPGDRLDEAEIGNARLRVSAQPNFRSVDIYLEKGSVRGRARVIVEVTETTRLTREVAAGLLAGASSRRAVAAGRLSDLNAFGGGEIVELFARGSAGDESEADALSARLQLVDPSLFGSQRYFLIAGLSYLDEEASNDDGEFIDIQESGVDLSIGRRIADFSYVSVGYQHFSHARTDSLLIDDGIPERETREFEGRWLFSYGWNTEDDLYFPTRGSRFNAGFAVTTVTATKGDGLHLTLGYRKHWQSSPDATWTVQVGPTPTTLYRTPELDPSMATSLGYAGTLERFGAARARWYVEAGLTNLGYATEAGWLWSYGAKAGVRFESKTFGIVDLYILGSSDFRGDDQ